MKTESQIYNSGRFSLYLRREFMLNGRQWLLRCALMLAAMTIILCYLGWPSTYLLNHKLGYSYTSTQEGACVSSFIIGLFVFVCGGGFYFMENMNTPGKRLNSLMVPASTFEKYLSRILICVLGTFIVYLLVFCIADAIRFCVIRMYFGDIRGLAYIGVPKFDISSSSIIASSLIVLATQATAVLGSAVWPNKPAPKTIAAVFIIGFLCISGFSLIFTEHMIGKVISNSGSDAIGNTFLAILATWTVFCYVTAYFRMRESEIIHRL